MDASVDRGDAGSGGTNSMIVGETGGQGAVGGTTCTPEGVDAFASHVLPCDEGCRNSCTFVVRLAYDSLDFLGWSVACGLSTHVDESTARQAALQATGYGNANATVKTQGDIVVFYEPANDFGGVAVVSTLSGKAVFGGGIVWMGKGNITFPTAWESPSQMGHGCGFASVGLASADVDSPAAAVGQTALAHAFPYGPSSVVTYLYTPTVGGTDYSVAEWLVFVSGLGLPGV